MFQKGVKFLHCADIHLDMPFYSLDIQKGISSERRQDLKKVFSKMINTAKSQKVDLILISGDMYEHDYVVKSTIAYINNRFLGIPEIKVIIVPGNHDPFLSDSYYNRFNWSRNVSILSRRNPKVFFEDLGVYVYGAGFENYREDTSLVKDIELPDSSFINILVTHGTVDMNIGKSIYNPMSSDELERLGMDYVAIGHFHNRIEGIGKNKSIYNPGSLEPLGFDESGDHGAIIGSIQKNEGQSKLETLFEKLNEKYYKTLDIDVNYSSNDEQIVDKIQQSLNGETLQDTFLRINLKGFVDEDFKIDIGLITSMLQGISYYIKILDNTECKRNIDKLLKEQGLIGVFTRNIKDRMDNASEEEKKILRDALNYGISAIERGKIEI